MSHFAGTPVIGARAMRSSRASRVRRVLTSVGTGFLVSKFGRYKWMPIVGSLFLAAGLLLLSTMSPQTPLWLFCIYLAVMGAGLGTSMQILVLIVQNTFHVRMVGTATASNNYFRQIGATLGSALVGSLFATRLFDLLSARLPPGGNLGGDGAHSLTPDAVKHLPEPLRAIIDQAYSDALTPLFLWMVPLALLAFVLLCFINEVPLATTIDRDTIVEQSISEGNIVVTAPVTIVERLRDDRIHE